MNSIEADVGNFLDQVDRSSTFAFVSGVVLGQPYTTMMKYIAPARALEQREGWALAMVTLRELSSLFIE